MIELYNSLRRSINFRIRLVGLCGILFCCVGLSALILSIVDLFKGRASVFHYDETQGGLQIENPLWPSSGKGFWVGLVLIATGLVGILASREWTPPSIVGFTTLAGVSTILSFYLMITCIISTQYDAKYSNLSRPDWQATELAVNSLLIAVSGFASFLGAIISLVGCCFAGCCANQRDDPRYSNEVNRIMIIKSGMLEHGTPYAARKDRPLQ